MLNTTSYKTWFIHYTNGKAVRVQSPTGDIIKLDGAKTTRAAKHAITRAIRSGDYVPVTKSGQVSDPEFRFTHCGTRSRSQVLKTGYLATGSGNDYKLTKRELERVRRLSPSCESCDLAELPAVKLTTETGDSWTASVGHDNTETDLRRYFVGTTFDRGTYDESKPNAGEDMQLCTEIEFIN